MAEPKRRLLKEVWLFLWNNEGEWTAAQVTEKLKAKTTPVSSALTQMHERGMVARTVSNRKFYPFVYFITPECRFPDRMTVADVLSKHNRSTVVHGHQHASPQRP